MLQNCPYTGEQFVPKRKNQVFASAKNRRDFHNEYAAELRRIKSPIDRALEKNFIILSELLQEGELKTFQREKLLIKGFNPSVFTNLDTFEGKPTLYLYHFVFPKSDNPNTITVKNLQKHD